LEKRLSKDDLKLFDENGQIKINLQYRKKPVCSTQYDFLFDNYF